jgi:hypothetical protein
MINSLQFISLILFLVLNISCSNKITSSSNKKFTEQYGAELVDIRRRIQDNAANAIKVNSKQYNVRTSLDIKRLRYGNYDKNAKIYFPTYLNYNFPEKYPVKKINFNDIKIPKIDNFDIATSMEKSYPLIDYSYLQSNIRQINQDEK